MPTPMEIQEQQELLETHRQTLAIHLKQRARHGRALAPPSVEHGIRDARNNVQQIKKTLRDWGVAVDDHPNDEEILITDTSGQIIAGESNTAAHVQRNSRNYSDNKAHAQGRSTSVVGEYNTITNVEANNEHLFYKAMREGGPTVRLFLISGFVISMIGFAIFAGTIIIGFTGAFDEKNIIPITAPIGFGIVFLGIVVASIGHTIAAMKRRN